MVKNSKRCRWPKLVAPALFAVLSAAPAFGFGGHPLPPGPPLIPQEIPAQPGDGGGVAEGSPSEEEVTIPSILLEPDKKDVIEPVFEAGGDQEFPPPPSTDTPAETPEPATLLMGLLGAGAVAGARVWKRRRLSR